MGNTNTKQKTKNSIVVYKQKDDHLKQISAQFNNSSSGRSYASVSSRQSTYSVSRPWSRVSRRRWKESTLTLPYQSSRTAWPVTQSESCFLPQFPVVSNNNEKFRTIQEVSRGTFGKVYKVEDIESGEKFALKVLSKSKIVRENSVGQVKEEVEIQKACGHHPFIVNCPANWQSRKKLYILTTFVPGGELFNLLKSYRILPIELVQLYVAQIALALDFLHNAGIIYRDLKPENILLDASLHVQLIDFGLSKWLSIGDKTKTICGTLRYMEMNARSQTFELTVEGRQADEAVASLFHTVLFHRSFGKFSYSGEGSFSVGTLGYTDVDCNFIDLTYVCCTSPGLDQTIKREVRQFSEQLRANESCGAGQISLEFFQRKPGRWMFQSECTPWEVWTVRLDLVSLENEGQRQECRERVGEVLADKVLYIAEVMDKRDYVPKMPTFSDLGNVFDVSYQDVQPYLFKVHHSVAGPSSGGSVSSSFKKFFRDTLSF